MMKDKIQNKRVLICISKDYNKVELEVTVDGDIALDEYNEIKTELIEEAKETISNISTSKAKKDRTYKPKAKNGHEYYEGPATQSQIDWVVNLGLSRYEAEEMTYAEANDYIRSHQNK